MGARDGKGKAVASFIRTRTGIPDVTWASSDSRILLPYPLGFEVVTSRNAMALRERVTALPEHNGGEITGVIRIDQWTPSTAEAWVVYRLDTATQLVRNYYDTAIRPRLESTE